MESRNTQYPVYIPDQFLTNGNLNETTGYVEMEERATRSYVLGNGVLKGLNIVKTNLSGTNVVSIELMPGYGLTPDGYLLETANALTASPTPLVLGFATDEGTFKLIKSPARKLFIYNDENLSEFMNGNVPKPGVTVDEVKCIEVFTAAPDAQADKRTVYGNIHTAVSKIPGFNVNTSVLAFLADIDDIPYDNCSQGNCNDKGTDRIIKGRFLIIPASALQLTSSVSLATISYLQLPRLSKISAMANPNDFTAKVGTAFDACKSSIATKLTTIGNNINTLIPKAAMDTAITRLNTFDADAQGHYAPNYLGLVYDLQQAINEYLTVYNAFAGKYPIISADRIDRLIVLGSLATTVPATDPYCYYFKTVATADAYKYHFEKLQKHYKRIIAIINQFYNAAATVEAKTGKTTAAIKVIPSAEFFMPLGDKAIPYYYNVDGAGNEIVKYWRAHVADSHTDHINNYFLPPQVPHAQQHIASYNFFRIEGHLGLDKTQALSKITSLIAQHDLPVKVIAVSLKKPTSPPIKGLYDTFRDKYKKFTEELAKANINYKTQAPVVNNIWQDMNQYSYRDTASLQKMLNDVSAVMKPVETYYTTSNTQEKEAIAGKWVFAKMSKTQQETIATQVKNTELLKARKDLEIAIKTTPPSDVVTISDFAGLEYLGGVYKGGTFILLHDGTKVVGDCSLPYFVNEK